MKTQLSSVQLPAHLSVINLKENYDFEILEEFYYRLLKPAFPISDELDNLETFIRHLTCDSHILETEIAVLYDEKTQSVAGGTIYDFYPVANVGLLSYFVVDQRDDRYRGMGLGRFLVEYAYNRTQMMANRYNKSKINRSHRKKWLKTMFARDPKTLNSIIQIFRKKYFLQKATKNDMFAFFAETNRVGVSDGVLNSEVRHKILYKLGFRFLDFDYVQAPLNTEAEPCHDLILLAYCPAAAADGSSSNANASSTQTGGTTSQQKMQEQHVCTPQGRCGTLRKEIALAFVTEFALSVTEDNSFSFRSEPFFKQMELMLRSKPEELELRGLPWVQSSNPIPMLSPSSDSNMHLH